MVRTPFRAVFLLSALVALACGGGDGAEQPLADTGLDAPDHTITPTPTPVFTVGGFDAPDWAAFGAIGQVAFDDRGHLYILDSQTNIVTEVDATGAFVRTIGRPGQGPGELSNAFAFTVTADGGVAIFDVSHQGWVVYDRDGTYVRTAKVDMSKLGIPGRTVAPHPAGGVVGAVSGRMRFGPSADDDAAESEAPSRPVAYFALSDADESRAVYSAWDLPEPPAGGEQSLSTSGGGRLQLRMSRLRAFEPGLFTGVLSDGRIAVVDSTGYRIKIVDMTGSVVEVLERPILPTPVTAAIQTREKERRMAEAEAQEGGPAVLIAVGGSGGMTVDRGAMRDMMTSRLETMIFAEEIPVIERMAVDQDGRIWVQRSSGEPGEPGPTDLLTTDGRYLGSLEAEGLRIPEAFGPDGLMVRIEEDEFDVPTLIVERMPAEIG